jgi:hypothetical protein
MHLENRHDIIECMHLENRHDIIESRDMII